ncbi:hypothetical protein [Streptomyces sp. NPDC059262]|uniref:hypothetical protein n=1 Tax=Streptomyces sp. NPDC059262 TaxID=3346797 RepID=UPI00368F1394
MFSVTTAALMVLMFKGGLALVGETTLSGRRIPWAAVGLTGIALAGPDNGPQGAGPAAEASADEGSPRPAARRTARMNRLLALAMPVLGLAMWFTQENGHGLVACYGFGLGVLAWVAFRTVLRPDRDLRQPPRTTMASLTGLVGRRARSAA